MTEIKDTPNPGSDEAVAMSCTCPILDNHKGAGVMVKGELAFWYAPNCSVHSKKESEE